MASRTTKNASRSTVTPANNPKPTNRSFFTKQVPLTNENMDTTNNITTMETIRTPGIVPSQPSVQLLLTHPSLPLRTDTDTNSKMTNPKQRSKNTMDNRETSSGTRIRSNQSSTRNPDGNPVSAGGQKMAVNSSSSSSASSSSSSSGHPSLTMEASTVSSSLSTLRTHPIKKVTSIDDTEDEVKWYLDRQRQEHEQRINHEPNEPITIDPYPSPLPSNTIIPSSSSSSSSSPPSSSSTVPSLDSLIKEWSVVLHHLGQNIRCPICLSIMTEPSSPDCGHTYCHDCIAAQIRVSGVCPQCRKGITLRQLKKDTTMAKIIYAYRGLLSETKAVQPPSNGPTVATVIPTKTTAKIETKNTKTETNTVVPMMVDNDRITNGNEGEDEEDNDDYDDKNTTNNTSFMMFTQIPDIHDIEEGYHTIVSSTHHNQQHHHNIERSTESRKNEEDNDDEDMFDPPFTKPTIEGISLITPNTSIHNVSTESTATTSTTASTTRASLSSTGKLKSILVNGNHTTTKNISTNTTTTTISTTTAEGPDNISLTAFVQPTEYPTNDNDPMIDHNSSITNPTPRRRLSVKFAPVAFETIEPIVSTMEDEETEAEVLEKEGNNDEVDDDDDDDEDIPLTHPDTAENMNTEEAVPLTPTTLHNLSTTLPVICNKIQGNCVACSSHRLYSPDRGYLRTCTHCQITMHSLCALDTHPVEFLPHPSLKIPVPWQCNVCANHSQRENLKCEVCLCSSPSLFPPVVREILQHHPSSAEHVQDLLRHQHSTKTKANPISSSKSSEKKRKRESTGKTNPTATVASSSSSSITVPSPEVILTIPSSSSDTNTKNNNNASILVPWIQNAVNPNVWVHLACARWLPYVQFVYKSSLAFVNLDEALAHALNQKRNTCDACGFGTKDSLAYGVTVPCSVPACTKRYHVMCAVRANLMLVALRNRDTPLTRKESNHNGSFVSSSSSSVSSHATLLEEGITGTGTGTNHPGNLVFDNESQMDIIPDDSTVGLVASLSSSSSSSTRSRAKGSKSYITPYNPVSRSVLPVYRDDGVGSSPSISSSSSESSLSPSIVYKYDTVHYLFCTEHTPRVLEERLRYREGIRTATQTKPQNILLPSVKNDAYDPDKVTLAQTNLSMAYKLLHEQQETTNDTKERKDRNASHSSSTVVTSTVPSTVTPPLPPLSLSTVSSSTGSNNRYICGTMEDKLGPGIGILMGFRAPALPSLPLPSQIYEKVTALNSSSSYTSSSSSSSSSVASGRSGRQSSSSSSSSSALIPYLFDEVWGAFTIADGGKQDIEYANDILKLGGIMRYIPDKYVNGITITKGGTGANRRNNKKDKETIPTDDIVIHPKDLPHTSPGTTNYIYRSLSTPVFPLTHVVVPATKITTEWSLLGKTSKTIRYYRSLVPSKLYEEVYTNDVNTFLNNVLEKSIHPSLVSSSVPSGSRSGNAKTPTNNGSKPNRRASTGSGNTAAVTPVSSVSSSSSSASSLSTSPSSSHLTANTITSMTVTTWLARRQSQRYLAGVMNGCYLVTTDWLESCAKECNGAIAHERPYLVAGDRESMHPCPPLRASILFGSQVYNVVNKYNLLVASSTATVGSSSSTIVSGMYPYELSAPGRARKSIESKDPRALLFSGLTFILWGEWENPPKNVSTMDAAELITLGGGRVIDLDLHTIPKEAIPSYEQFIKATRENDTSSRTEVDNTLPKNNRGRAKESSSSSSSSSSSVITIPLRTTSGLYRPLDNHILHHYGIDSAEWSAILLHIASLYPHLVIQTPKRTNKTYNPPDESMHSSTSTGSLSSSNSNSSGSSSSTSTVTIPPIIILCDEPHFALPESLVQLIQQIPNLVTVLTPNWLYDCASTYSLLYPSVGLNHIHPAYEPYC